MQRVLRACAVRHSARSYATKAPSAGPLATLTAQEKKMFKTSRVKGVKSGGSALKMLHRYMKQYDALSPAKRRPYERRAQQNRRMRTADRTIIRSLRTSAYSLFMKKHYAAVAAKYAHITDATKKLRAVARAVGAKWKSTSRAQRQALRSQAMQQRTGAARKLVVLVKKMKKN